MKNFKKMLALVIAMVMIVGTMNLAAFAATPEGLTADSTVTISGLDANDTVNLYKVIEWDEGTAERRAGWVLTDPFKDDDACKAVLQAINAVTDGVYTLTEADVKAFTDVINDGADSVKTTGGAVSGGSSVTSVDPGMYIALVKPAKTDTLYNPIIVSADYNADNGTNIMGSSVPLSQAMVGDATATAKKETLKVEKTQDDPQDTTDNSVDVGDTVTFTVKTTIPTFADVYENPTFKITDTMSDGLAITTGTFTVKVGGEEVADLADLVVVNSSQKWTLDLTGTDYVKLEAPTSIEITYDAVLTEDVFTSVNEETNDVEVEFSNNPDDDSDTGKVKDKTRTYTFSIDGNLLGGGGDQTSELVKVAVDGNGDPIIQASATGKTYENALAGALFGLYRTEADANADTNRYTNDAFEGTVTTDKDGYMQINGLDAGEYWLKEISAPAGFIKDQKAHKIVISADYDTETVEDPEGYFYTLPVLKSYTITIDDATTSTYNMKLEASAITTSDAENLPTSIQNTKGVELPSTGGMGTTLFYIIGAVLVLGAGILLVTRRRMSAN